MYNRSWKREYETKCDAYELNIDPMTNKKKWTKRGINGDFIIYSNVDNIFDLKVRFELHNIQTWWKIFNPKLKKKGSKTRVVTFKRLSTKEETKETIALRFKNPQICQSFIAKWESLTRDMEYEPTEEEEPDENEDKKDDDNDDDGKQQTEDKETTNGTKNEEKKQTEIDEVEDEKQIERLVKIADKSSFRDMIKINRLPSIDLINSSQILSEYYFNYNIVDKVSIDKNVINYGNYTYGKYNNEEHYLSLWMNSEVLRRVFLNQYKRPKVNIVICFDVSESMNESLCINERTRIEIAQEAIIQLIRHSLDKQDRFGIITYNERPTIEYAMTLVDDLPYGMVNLRRAILKFKASGTTNLEKAYQTAINLYTDEILQNAEKEGVYNRVFFLTDLQLNKDKIEQYNSKKGIFGMIKDAAENKKIYTTFLSVGVSQNEQLFHSSLSRVQGCNYLSVHDKQGFISKFHKEKEFPFMIRPILTDLNVTLNTKIQQAYTDTLDSGNIKSGQILNVKSLFGNINYSQPLIIKFNYQKQLKLKTEFTTNDGKIHTNEQIIDLTYSMDDDEDNIYFKQDLEKSKLVQQKDFYDSLGIRKVVVLCRYIDILRQWIKTDTKEAQHSDDGNKLHVSSKWRERFTEFIQYFEKEMIAIGDNTLQKELDILKKLAVYQDTVDID